MNLLTVEGTVSILGPGVGTFNPGFAIMTWYFFSIFFSFPCEIEMPQLAPADWASIC